MADRVHVVVRFRPLNETEKENGGQQLCVKCISESEVDLLANAAIGGVAPPPRQYSFDQVLPIETSQQQLFQKVGISTVDTVMKGYNGTVLAYGQTGSGKTHSMFGPGGGTVDVLSPDSPFYKERGFLPRVVEELFSRLEALPKAEISYSLTCSVFELYKENIIDLLSSREDGNIEYRIREDTVGGRGIYVENLFAKKCTSVSEVMEALRTGTAKRRVASTKSNETSSRSHSLTILTVEQVNHVKGDSVTRSRLNVVDLAGSEKVGKTQATGERLKEAQTINLSLTLLGNVIYKLTDGKSVYIPYRDSKLTRLLQESFGGNAVTTLLCHCSPAPYNREETASTLQFAARAKQIKNKPRINRQLSGDELLLAYNRALEEIRMLKDRLALLEESSPTRARQRTLLDSSAALSLSSGENTSKQADTGAGGNSPPPGDDDKDAQMQSLRATIEALLREKAELERDVFDRDEKLLDMQKQIEFYRLKFTAAEEQLNEATNRFKNREQLLEKHKLDLESEVVQLKARLQAGSGKPTTPAGSALGKGRNSNIPEVKELPVAGAAMKIRRTTSGSGVGMTRKPLSDSSATPGSVKEPTSMQGLLPPAQLEVLTPPATLGGSDPAGSPVDQANKGPSPKETELRLRIDELERELEAALKKLQLAQTKITALEANNNAMLGRIEDLEGEKDGLARQLETKSKLLEDTEKQNAQMRFILEGLGIDLEEQVRQLGLEKMRNSELSAEAGNLRVHATELEQTREQQEYCEFVSLELMVKTEDVETIEREADLIESDSLDYAFMRATSISCLRTAGELDAIFTKLISELNAKGKFVTANLEAHRLNLISDAKALQRRCDLVRRVLTAQ